MSMNSTKRKRLGLAGNRASKGYLDFEGDTSFAPDGKPACTLTADGTLILHDQQMLEAAKFFMPPGTKIIIGPYLSELDFSGEERQ